MRFFTPFRLLLLALVVAAAAFGVWAYPTGDYIFLPNRAHAVAPLVKVEGGHDPEDGGGVYFVDVLVRKATLVERVWPDVREGATVVPAEAVRPPGVSEAERRRGELEEMRQSQQVAAAVALQELGYRVVARPVGARIEFVDPTAPAEGVLKPGDIVVRALGGKRMFASCETITPMIARPSVPRIVRTRSGTSSPSRRTVSGISAPTRCADTSRRSSPGTRTRWPSARTTMSPGFNTPSAGAVGSTNSIRAPTGLATTL